MPGFVDYLSSFLPGSGPAPPIPPTQNVFGMQRPFGLGAPAAPPDPALLPPRATTPLPPIPTFAPRAPPPPPAAGLSGAPPPADFGVGYGIGNNIGRGADIVAGLAAKLAGAAFGPNAGTQEIVGGIPNFVRGVAGMPPSPPDAAPAAPAAPAKPVSKTPATDAVPATLAPARGRGPFGPMSPLQAQALQGFLPRQAMPAEIAQRDLLTMFEGQRQRDLQGIKLTPEAQAAETEYQTNLEKILTKYGLLSALKDTN